MLEAWRAFPHLTRGGLVVMGIGLGLDVTLHALSGAAAPEHVAHAVIIAGMVLVILGVIADGIGRTRYRQRSTT